MKTASLLYLLVLILLSTSCENKPYTLVSGYMYVQNPERRNVSAKLELVWEDNFDKGALDTNSWSRIGLFTSPEWKVPVAKWKEVKHCFRYITATDPRVVRFDKTNILLKGIINTDTIKGDPRPYLTGGIYSKRKFAFQYGRIEIRAKFDHAYGMWPAIWMQSENEIYPDQHNGEIDIMEKLNHDDFVYQTTHNHFTMSFKELFPKIFKRAKIDKDGYNIYSLNWYPDKLVFGVNGVNTYEYRKIPGAGTYQWPYDQPFYLIIDQQLEHAWPGMITNPEELPISMTVDWVRLYQ